MYSSNLDWLLTRGQKFLFSITMNIYIYWLETLKWLRIDLFYSVYHVIIMLLLCLFMHDAWGIFMMLHINIINAWMICIYILYIFDVDQYHCIGLGHILIQITRQYFEFKFHSSAYNYIMSCEFFSKCMSLISSNEWNGLINTFYCMI